MKLTQDEEEEELILLEDAQVSTLEKARTLLGHLLWVEDSFTTRLGRTIFEYKEDPTACTVYAGLLAESRERTRKLLSIDLQLKEALREKARKTLGPAKELRLV